MPDLLDHRGREVSIVFLLLALGGLFALRRLPVDIFPDLDYPLLNVITHQAGGSPGDVEVLVTRPIETQMSGLPDVRRISSISRQELSRVTVEFDWGVDARDARQRVAQALSTVAPDLPPGARPVIEDLGSSLREILDLGVTDTSGALGPGELKTWVHTHVANPLKGVAGVARIEVVGGRDEAFVVRPDPLALARYGLSFADVRDVLAADNVQVVAGYAERAYQDYAVRGPGMIRGVDDLKSIGIPRAGVPSPRLGEIATVQRGSLPRRYTVHLDGREGVALRIFKGPGADTPGVAAAVGRRLAEIERTLPVGVAVTRLYDQSEVIDEAAASLETNILVGVFLVVLVLFVFLGSLRRALLIAVAIPLSAVVSLLFLRWGHFSLNMITMGAMAVGVGMVVDDSIIVVEVILRHREAGKAPLAAARDGLREIRGATLSGTLTTAAAFLPFLFLPGLGGRFAGPFGWTMIILLLTSLVISLTLLPARLARERGTGAAPRGALVPGAIAAFTRLNRRILRLFLRRRAWVLSGALLAFLLSAGLLAFSPVRLLPPIDEGAILMEYILPPGTSLRESDRIGGVIEGLFRQDPDVETVYRRTGSEMTSYGVEPVNRGEIVARLRDRDERDRDIFRIMRDLRAGTDAIPGVITLYHQVTSEKMDESLSGLPTLFGITLYGEDYDRLLEIAAEVEAMAARTPGVESVVNNTKYRVPEVRVEPMADPMARYGLTARDLLEEVKLYVGGETVTRVIRGERQIPVYLRGRPDSRWRPGEIEGLPIRTPGGAFVPLSRVARLSTDSGPSAITHIDRAREVTLPVEIDGSPGAVIRRLRAGLEAIDVPRDVLVEFGGRYPLLLDVLKGFVVFALIGLLLVYLIMSVQFGDALHPLVILAELPLSMIGAFVAIAATRQPLNVSFWIGLITLIGVSVNNGIVLIDAVNGRRRGGMERAAAIEEAAAVRARPILLTTLTSILALLPVSLGWGIGSTIHQPLAICVMGGLLVNTLLTLNVLPVVYCVAEDLFRRGGGPEAAASPGQNA